MSRKNKLTNKNFLPTPVESIEPIPTPVEQLQPPETPPTPVLPITLPRTTYDIISITNDINLFTRTVNECIQNGWQLQGGVATNYITTDYNVTVVYTQAVVKHS